MLTIRNDQLKVLGAEVEKEFLNRLHWYLESTYPEQVRALPASGLDAFIGRAKASAVSLGLSAEYDVARWSEILLLHGEDFGAAERTAWARPILDNPAAPAADKLSRIDAWLRAEQTFRRRAEEGAHGE